MWRHRRIYEGFALLLFSYCYFLFPQNLTGKFLGAIFFNLGIIYVCESITIALAGKSLMREIRKSWHNVIVFFAISALGGLFLDGIAKFLGKLWIYPGWHLSFYLLIFIPGWAFYWLVITETYLAIKTIIDYLRGGRQTVNKLYAFERSLYVALGAIGVLLIAYVIGTATTAFQNQTLPLITSTDLGTSNATFQISFFEVMILCFGIFFVFEAIEFFRHKTSLIRDTVHHYYTPLIAIIISSLGTAVLMEIQNVPVGLWVYTRWPVNELMLLGIPILAVVAWPMHYVAFLSGVSCPDRN